MIQTALITLPASGEPVKSINRHTSAHPYFGEGRLVCPSHSITSERACRTSISDFSHPQAWLASDVVPYFTGIIRWPYGESDHIT